MLPCHCPRSISFAAQALIEGDSGFVQPAARRNEVLGWVHEGLRDFSISRAAVSWGIPIPRDPAQTVYVWFDALLGYMSGARGTLSALQNEGFRLYYMDVYATTSFIIALEVLARIHQST